MDDGKGIVGTNSLMVFRTKRKKIYENISQILNKPKQNLHLIY